MPPAPSPKFPITLVFRGGLSSSQMSIFGAAAARWQSVIIAPLAAVKVGTKTTTGIIIEAQGTVIDGPMGILGQAGPTRLRPNLLSMGSGALLPCAGTMSFDAADLAVMEHDGSLLDVITHEMGHVLGIGTAWRNKMKLLGAGTVNPTFVGSKAEAEYGKLLGTGPASVLVENNGGPGTRDSHWRERAFGQELMTGFISAPGVKNPLSPMTVASLADIGYMVDVTKADPYTLPHALEMAMMSPVPRPHCITLIPMHPEDPANHGEEA